MHLTHKLTWGAIDLISRSRDFPMKKHIGLNSCNKKHMFVPSSIMIALNQTFFFVLQATDLGICILCGVADVSLLFWLNVNYSDKYFIQL